MQVEVEDAIGSTNESIPGGAAITAEAGAGMSFSEKVTVAVLGTLGTGFLTMMGMALKRRNKEQGTEDVVWGTANETIKRLQAELELMRKESDTMRTQRNEFEAAATRAENNSKIASDAAARASEAAQRNEADLINLRHNWEKSQRYIHILRSTLAQNNLDIPPEPDH